MTQAKQGDNVTIHYTGRLIDGTIFDSSQGRDPLPVTLGSGQVIAGLEEAVIGMSAGESKTINIPHGKAYGRYYEGQVVNFPINRIPSNIKIEVGMQLQLRSQDGNPFKVRVIEVFKEHIKIDANLPLAGQDLVFDIELITIDA